MLLKKLITGCDFLDTLLKKIDKLVIFFIAYTLIFILFLGTLDYTLPFVLAFIFAFLLQKPTLFIMNKFNIKNWLASLLTSSIFSLIFISLLIGSIILISSELFQLTKNLQYVINNNFDYFSTISNKLISFYNKLDPSIVDTINKNLSDVGTKAATYAYDFTKTTISFLLEKLFSIPYIMTVVLFTILSTYFLTKDFTTYKYKIKSILPKNSTDRLSDILFETKRMLGNYVASYFLIIFITFLETLIGLYFLDIKYALLLSLLVAALDLLPILGIASVYLPLCIVYSIQGNYFIVSGLFILYLLITFFRQIIEPKIVSSSLGINPFASLVAIFIGLRAYGFLGMFFCMFLLVFYNIFKKVDIL